MQKIANSDELQVELQRILATCRGPDRPSRILIARDLRVLAHCLVAMEHPSEEAKKKYLSEHPDADPKNHTVKDGGVDKAQGAVNDWLKKNPKVMMGLIQSMSSEAKKDKQPFGMRDARSALKAWFDGKEPSDPKGKAAWRYMTSDKGKKALGKLTKGVGDALKKGGGKVGFRDIAKAVDTWMSY